MDRVVAGGSVTTPKPQMPELHNVIFDLAHNRAQYIDQLIERRSNHRGWDITDQQRDAWTKEAVQRWRELYPTLQALWVYHESVQREAKEEQL